MWKWFRVLAVVLLCGFVCILAALATRDCTADIYTSENCLWLWLRERLGLPQSKLLRAVALELVGLTLLAALYATWRYVFAPLRRSRGTFQKSDANPKDPGLA